MPVVDTRLATFILLLAAAGCSDAVKDSGRSPSRDSGVSPGPGSPPASSGGSSSTGGAPGTGGTSAGGGGSGGAATGGSGAGGTPTDAGTDALAADDGAVAVPPPEPTGCVTDVSAGKRTVSCNGLTHDIDVPARCLTTQCGLIFDVHGGTMSGAMEDKNTNLAALGEKYGFVVVHPNAVNGLWNYTTDDPKVYYFMMDMQQAFHTDPKHLHITGISQGGYMSWRFICQHTDAIASAAPAAAAGAAKISIEVGCTFTGTDHPSAELDILYMHGTQDGLVDFQNAVTLRDAVVAYYKMSKGEVIGGDGTFYRTRYTAPGGHVFEFIQHDYVSSSTWGLPPLAGVAIKGHCFPGSDDQTITLPGQLMAFGCNPPNSFTWGEEVMKFFIAHPKH